MHSTFQFDFFYSDHALQLFCNTSNNCFTLVGCSFLAFQSSSSRSSCIGLQSGDCGVHVIFSAFRVLMTIVSESICRYKYFEIFLLLHTILFWI